MPEELDGYVFQRWIGGASIRDVRESLRNQFALEIPFEVVRRRFVEFSEGR